MSIQKEWYFKIFFLQKKDLLIFTTERIVILMDEIFNQTKLIILRIIISKFLIINQLLHVKNGCIFFTKKSIILD